MGFVLQLTSHGGVKVSTVSVADAGHKEAWVPTTYEGSRVMLVNGRFHITCSRCSLHTIEPPFDLEAVLKVERQEEPVGSGR